MIRLDPTISLGFIITFFAFLGTLVWNCIQYWQMKNQLKIQNEQLKQQNEQTRHNYFSEYTKRYQDIILHFPENINEEDFSYEDLDEGTRRTTLRYMRVYFDLCSEEFFLKKHKYIMSNVWEEWEQGMKFAFKKPAFRTAWRKIFQDTNYFIDFAEFVNKNMGLNGKNQSSFYQEELAAIGRA